VNSRYLLCITILMVAAISYQKENKRMNCAAKEQVLTKFEKAPPSVNPVQVVTKHYHKNGITAEYPVLIGGGSKSDLLHWNQLIKTDFDKILSIYSFYPYPEPALKHDEMETINLDITYLIKVNEYHLLSIFYTADYSSTFSAHPSQLIYTTNLDLTVDKRLRLSDVVELNNAFVTDFRTWDLVSYEVGNKEYNQAIYDYVAGLSDEDLLMGFQTADIIGTGNLWGDYSYLTHNRLGISLGVPTYIGDHVEYEKKYTRLQDFLKPDFRLI